MLNKYSYSILLALLTVGINAFGQFKDIMPVSPEAGALAKYVNYPISYNTGVPNINIPLYELKAGELNLPVNLSYHAGGFKINEQSGNVGLGWSLSTDLQITAKINGFSDLTPLTGYIYNGLINRLGGYGSYNTSDNDGRDYRNIEFLNNFYNYENCYKVKKNLIDLQPDEFYFKLLNKSGKFFFRPDGKIETVPSNGVKIYLTPRGVNSSCKFQITDTDGTIYIFGDGLAFDQTTAAELQESYPYDASSWKCTKIISPSKSDSIELKYKTGEKKYTFNFDKSIEFISTENSTFDIYDGRLRYPEEPIISSNLGQGYNAISMFPSYVLASPKYISHHGSDAGVNLLDINGNWVCYSFRDQAPNICRGTQTLKLDVISYNGLSGGLAMHYNYLNNSSNQLSSINITDGQTNQTIRFSQSVVTSATSPDLRECNKTYYLDSVRTSSNDKYSFSYFNKVVFNNHSAGSDAWGGASQLTCDGLDKTISSMKYLPYSNLISNNYGNTTTKEMGSLQILDFDMLNPIDYQVDESRIKNGILEWIKYPTGGSTFFEFGPNEYWDSEAGERRLAGGLRINKIKSYKGNDGWSQVSEKIYKYGEDESGYGLIKNRFETSPNGVTEGFYYTQRRKYLQFTGSPESPPQSYYVMQEENKTTLLPGTMTDMFYSSGAPIYYTEVAEYNKEDGEMSGKTVYNYVIPQSNYYTNMFKDYTNIYVRNENWNKGQLISETYFKKNALTFDTIKSKTYEYSEVVLGEIPVIEVFQDTEYCDADTYEDLLPDPGYDDPSRYTQQYITAYDFTVVDYGLPVGDMLLTKEVEKSYDGLNKIVNTNNYFYEHLYQDNEFYAPQLARTETVLSNGKVQKTYFTYPHNYTSDTPFIGSLKRNFIQTALIEKITTIDGKIIDGKLNTYSTDNPGLVAKTFQLDPSSPLALSNFNSIRNGESSLYIKIQDSLGFIQDPAYYEKFSLTYDNKRLSMVTPTANVPTSYYWGYRNTYPVIKAENVNKSDLNAAVNNALSIVGKSTFDELTNAIGNMTTSVQKTIYHNFITALRNNTLLSNALLTTYTYSLLTGMTSQTDSKGMTTYYEYDNTQRLKSIKDLNSNIIKSYNYHYKQ